VKGNSVFFLIIGTFILSFLTNNFDGRLSPAFGIHLKDKNDIASIEEQDVPIKNKLIGTYVVQEDKLTKLDINEDGSYALTINVCEKYIELFGNYEIRDTKIKLINSNYSYDDLNGNEELTFLIVDDNTLKAEESLVCVPQETLFEK
jgi:hypothetical protein